MIISVLALFAISASAADIPEWTDITTVDGMPDKATFGDDGRAGATSRVLMADGVTYPAYYICKNSASLGISFTDLNSKSGKSYSAVDVVRLEIPKGVTSTPTSVLRTENGYTALKTADFPEGFTTLGGYTFKGTADLPSALVSVGLPSTLNSIGESAFIDCYSLEALIIPEGVTSIPKNMALNTTSLKTLVLPSTLESIGYTSFKLSNLSDGLVIPEGCTTIDGYAFKQSGVTSVTLPSTLETVSANIFEACSSLTTVYSKSPIIGELMFYDCDELTTIKLENTVEIKKQAFCNPSGGILKITSLELPEGLTTIGSYAFPRSQLTELVLPSTLTTMSDHAFATSTTLKRVVALNSCFGATMFEGCSSLCELVITEKFDTLGSGALNSVSQTSFITYYTGTDYDRIKSVFSATTRLSQAKYYSYEDYKNENYTYNKFMVIYDANLCEVAFDGVHSPQEGEADCVNALGCSRCPLVYEEALGHEFDLEKGASVKNIVYKSFGADGHYEIKCARCDECDSSTVISAIFAPRGYSVNPNGTGFATGFLINQSSLKAYEDFYNTKLTFGILIFNPTYLDDSSLFVDGKVNCSRGVVQVSMDTIYSSCSLSVNGFTSAHEGLELVFAGFAYEGDDTDNIQVFQKEYNSTQENPVSSPMSKKVTRGNFVLYSVCLGSIKAPAVMPNKSELDEFLKA